MPVLVDQSCSSGTCGTGGWAGPLPGDPGAVFGLTATPAFGGIQLKWNLPGINPQAIAYVTIYRGYLPEFEHAINLVEWSGSGYFDQTGHGEPLSVKYYWIQVMSVNGTLGDVIGPASATARPTITQLIEILTGQIDNGVLAQSLKDKLAQITELETNLSGEIANRVQNSANLQAAITELSTLVGEAQTLVVDEVTQRVDGQTVILEALSQLGASSGDNLALIQNQLDAQADELSALASDIETLYTKAGENLAAIEVATAAYVNADIALAEQITAVEVAAGGSLAQARTEISTEIGLVDGKATAIGARWTAQVSVDGLIGGFGVYNNGAFMEAGFDVDKFWIGRTTMKVKPFIVVGEEVFIKKAVIGTVTADMVDARGLIVRDGSGNPTLEIGETGDVVVTGTLRSGQTAWDTGTGFWMGKVSGVPKMSFGTPTKGFTWDGSTFNIRGDVVDSGNLKLGAVNSVATAKVLTPVEITGPYYGTPEVPLDTTYGNAVELPSIFIPANAGVLLSFIWDYQQWGSSGSRVFIRVIRVVGGTKTVIYTIRTATTGTGTLGAQYPIGGQVADMGASGNCVYAIEVMQMDYMDRVQVNYAELAATVFKRVT